MDKDIKLAKIVATATPNSWSQAYNAGKLFAVISLESETPQEENSLSIFGKEILENLEAEFFTLETKDMESVKSAVSKALEKTQEGVKISLTVGAITKNILYVFAKGKGQVHIKRADKLGKILEGEENELVSGSGFLEDKDIVILETPQFADIVTADILTGTLDSQPVEQIAESLAPKVHEKEGGSASAVILEFNKENEEEFIQEPSMPLQNESENELEATQQASERNLFFAKYLTLAKDKVQTINYRPSFDRSRKNIMTVAVILLLVLLMSIFFTIKKQNEAKAKALLDQYYAPAQKKYDEGQSLLDLNQALARDDFANAQKLLNEGEGKFEKGTSERKQVDDLLAKVNDALNKTANIKVVTPQAVDSSQSKLLASEQNSGSSYAAKENSDIYTLDQTGVLKNGKNIIKKDWGMAGGLGVYYGNVYVLSKSNKQILKFVSTSSGYVETNYFTGTAPDVSNGQALAIDGSIWVLLKDGTVMKFTRGNSDNLSLTGLDKPFSSPTRIFTDVNTNNVYILDNGNSRIVVFNKDGAFQAQYQSPLLKDAKDFEVNEGDKKIYILSGGKIYLMNL